MIRFLIQAVIGIVSWGVLSYAIYEAMPRATNYSCDVASIHKDKENKVKKQCRELKGGKR